MKEITPHLVLGHGHFFQNTLLSASRFVDYCKKRGIKIDERRLEKFEKLGMFYPMLRIKHPRLKIKIRKVETETDTYTEECGILEEGEEWDGDINIDYAFLDYRKKEYIDSWINDGLVYIPSNKTFQPWSDYRIGDDFQKQTETYYSIFQTLPLYLLTHKMTSPIGIENLATWTQKEIKNWFKWAKQDAKSLVKSCQESEGIRDELANLGQVLSSRYLPYAEKYEGMISLPHDESFDWREYRLNWNAEELLDELGLTVEKIARYYEVAESQASYDDPLDRWNDLVQFVRNSKKEQLKDAALLAQTWRVLGRIINLFHRDLTGDFIYSYGKDVKTKERIYGKDVPQNNLAFLEYVSNEFGVNPRPKLYLFVEGDGEVEQFPRLAIELLGIDFSEIRIQIQNLHGVSGFEGDKKVDKYGALEKLIEYYHDKQTIAFFILDKEGRVENVKQKLITKASKEHPNRTITRNEYIKLWDKNVEFDNFTNKEIAEAMTKLSKNLYLFTEDEIEDCRNRFGKRNQGDTLSKLYKDKCDYGSNKIRLLGILIDYAVLSPKFEVDGIEVVRPLIKVIEDVCYLAMRNYQPLSLESWKETQDSEWLGHLINQ
jgi:hypothetical protein